MALMTQKDINRLLANIKKHGKQWQDEVQEACIQATGHVLMHGNIMPAVAIANDLLSSMPEGSRKQAIVSYLEAVGFLKYHPKTKDKPATFKFYDKIKIAPAPFQCEKIWTDEYETMLRMIPWYSFTKEKVKSTHTIMADVQAFIASMERRYQAKDMAEQPKDSELLQFIKEAFDSYKEHKESRAAEAKDNAIAAAMPVALAA